MKTQDQDGMIRHGLLVLALTHGAGLASAVFHSAMGRLLSVQEYGILTTLLSAVLAAFTPLTALQNTLAYAVTDGSPRASQTIRRWLRIMGGGATLVLLVAWITRHAVAGFLHIDGTMPVLITAGVIALSMLLPVLTGALQGVQAFVWMCVAANAWGIVRLLAGWTGVWLIEPTATTAMAAYLLGVAISITLGVAGWRLTRGHGNPVAAAPATTHADDSVYFLCSLGTIVAYSALMYSDMLIVKHFFPNPADYGNYAKASVIARMLVFLPQPLAGALFPKVRSDGRTSQLHVTALLKALGIGLLLTAGPMLVCVVLPALPLAILYGIHEPTPELIGIVRGVSLSLAPLGMIFVLMNFELAQRRFTCAIPLVLAAGGVWLAAGHMHSSTRSIAWIVGCATFMALAALTGLLIRSVRRSA